MINKFINCLSARLRNYSIGLGCASPDRLISQCSLRQPINKYRVHAYGRGNGFTEAVLIDWTGPWLALRSLPRTMLRGQRSPAVNFTSLPLRKFSFSASY